MSSCRQCGAPCQGRRCKQCAIEAAHEDQAAELRDERERDTSGHSSTLAQLRQAKRDGDLPDDIAARHDLDGDDGGDGE